VPVAAENFKKSLRVTTINPSLVLVIETSHPTTADSLA
jgi:hypothetical protein